MCSPDSAEAKTKIVVTYPYIESLVQRDSPRTRSTSPTLAKGDEDPHFVVPRPSFIGKLRQADLLIINGASLEIGFVPPLIRQANNPKIMPGAEGFIDLSQSVELIDKPDKVSRSEGDIHPEGNPHFILDWHNVPAVARAIADALGRADRAGKDAYQKNLDAFLAAVERAVGRVGQEGRAPSGQEDHPVPPALQLLCAANGDADRRRARAEARHPPTSRHLEELIEANAAGTVYRVVADAVSREEVARGPGEEAGIPWIVLPHDVGAVAEAKDIFSLYDTLIARSLK